MIFWKSHQDKELIYKIISPTAPEPSQTLDQCINQYYSQGFKNDQERRSANGYIKRILKIISPTKEIAHLTVLDANNLVKGLIKKGITEQKAHATRGYLGRILRYVLTGHQNSIIRRESSSPIRLKIANAPLEKLSQLIGPRSSGRWATLKTDILKAIDECPINEFRVISPSKFIKENEEERESLRLGVQKVLKKLKPDWIIRWAIGEEIFVLTTKQAWKNARKGII